MSFGVGFGDILAGYKICKRLYECCFEHRFSANAQYVQFGQEINKLGILLESLPRHTRTGLDHHDADDGSRTLYNLVEDFLPTLEQCESFLKHHSQFQWRSGVIVNISWNTMTQSRVEELRQQVHFHTRKIQFAVNLGLYSMSAEMTELLRDTWDDAQMENQEQKLKKHPVPDSLKACFEKAALDDAPQSYDPKGSWPLKESSDALLWNFERSTRSVPRADQTIQQYLNTLKSHWILDKLKGNSAFSSMPATSKFRHAILKIGRDICRAYADLETYAEQTLLSLDQASYRIWVPAVTSPSNEPSEAGEQEEKILDVAIEGERGFRATRLTLFRRSQTHIRFLRERTPDGSTVPHPVSELVDPQYISLIPRYAIPMNHSTFHMEIRQGNRTGLYSFRSLNDVLAFQNAITGYKVVMDIPKVSWTIDTRRRLNLRGKEREGFGRLQLWRPKPLPEITSPTVLPLHLVNSNDRSRQSLASVATNFTVARATNGTAPSLFSVTETSTSNDVSALIAATSFVPPILVIMCATSDSYSITYIELDEGHSIPNTAPTTPNSFRVAPDVTLQHRKKNFTVRRRVTSRDATGNPRLDQWSLSLLGRPFPDNRSPNPLLADESVFEKLAAGYMSFDFDSDTDRQRFIDVMPKMFAVIRADRIERDRLSQGIERTSGRPVDIERGYGNGSLASPSRGSFASPFRGSLPSPPRTQSRTNSDVSSNQPFGIAREPPTLPSPPLSPWNFSFN